MARLDTGRKYKVILKFYVESKNIKMYGIFHSVVTGNLRIF